MTQTLDIISEIKARIAKEGRVLTVPYSTVTGFFDPGLVTQVNSKNFGAIPLQPRLIDLLLLRKETNPVLWDEVRTAFIVQMKRLTTPASLLALHARMAGLARESQDREVDLTWVSEQMISRPLIPIVIDGLAPNDERAMTRDQDAKLRFVLSMDRDPRTGQDPRRVRAQKHLAQIAATFAVTRTLKQRLSGKTPPREDLAQAVLPLAKRLGLSRLSYTVTAALTAIAGAPGTVGACLLFELKSRPEWEKAIRAELSSISLEDLCIAPIRNAGTTHRFIKEVLRFWSFPVMAFRRVYRDISVGGCPLARGDHYAVSSYLTHRDEAYWRDPEEFDPNRWLKVEADLPPETFVPFGWAPMTCVGAAYGLAQLILFCRLMTVDFQVEIANPSIGRILVAGIASPIDFNGVIRRATLTVESER